MGAERRRRGAVVLRSAAGGYSWLEPLPGEAGQLLLWLYQKEPAYRPARFRLHQRLLRARGTPAPVLARLARRQRVGAGAAGAAAELPDAVRRVGKILRDRSGQLAADGDLPALAPRHLVFPHARHEHPSDAAGRLPFRRAGAAISPYRAGDGGGWRGDDRGQRGADGERAGGVRSSSLGAPDLAGRGPYAGVGSGAGRL